MLLKTAQSENAARAHARSRLLSADHKSGPIGAADSLIHMQRARGNRYVQRLLNGAMIQAKLMVNQPGDKSEQEADRVAEGINRMPQASVEEQAGRAKPVVRRRVPESGSGLTQAPPVVNEVHRSSGQPLDSASREFFETRLGHDFSRVRVHTDAKAAESARAVNALAYTVGRDVVFGAGQYAPRTAAGWRLLAHELTHVVQSRVADSASSQVIRRDVVMDSKGNFISYEFRVGHELTESFASKAKKLTADGTMSDDDLRKLRDEALKLRETVNDHERMFMAGLLDAASVKTLQATKIDPKASVTFSLSSITATNVQRVIDLDRGAVPASVSAPLAKSGKALLDVDPLEALKQLGKAEKAAAKEIKSHAGASFKSQADALIKFAQSHAVFLNIVLQSMLAAASDKSGGDRVMAGVAYAVAMAAGHTLAADLLTGKIKIDALSPSNFAKLPGTGGLNAIYVAAAPINPKLAGLKGDTIYVQTDLDINNLNDRAAIIHELRHAEDDKAASPTKQPTFPTQREQEVAAYRAQARYILDQMSAQSAADQKRSAGEVVTPINNPVLLGVLIEAKTDLKKYQSLVELIFDAATPPARKTAAEVAKLLAVSTTKLEGVLLSEIEKAYGITATSTSITEGLAGESLIHWIHRL